ncbi:hypothetical protein LZC95_03255 [Pendulispora brunnea]|uniref:Secreted protein n=1 Tax=Pendulispora brunnea TaxID=2905690 RepID=A0ABZ2KEB3_9BACT
MSVSKLWRVVGVGSFVAAGYVGCTCTPPPNNPPAGETCVNPSFSPTKWAFVDQGCGCRQDDAKCLYEARIMRCFAASKAEPYHCGNLPPISLAKDNQRQVWERLDLSALQLSKETVSRLHDCIDEVNKEPSISSCPAGSSGKPVAGHFSRSCETSAGLQASSASSEAFDSGSPAPAQYPCTGGGCALPEPNALWYPCTGAGCCLPDGKDASTPR